MIGDYHLVELALQVLSAAMVIAEVFAKDSTCMSLIQKNDMVRLYDY